MSAARSEFSIVEVMRFVILGTGGGSQIGENAPDGSMGWIFQDLSPPPVTTMATTNRLDDYPDLPEGVRRTEPWGLGWRLNHLGMPGSWGDLLGRHVFGHTGSAGNVVWMDPQTQGFCILFTNYLRARAPWRLVHLSNAIAAAFV